MAKAPTQALTRVVNLTDAVIELPPVPPSKENPKGWPAKALIPGGNNVPTAYLTDLGKYESKDAFGNVTRPGAEHLRKLTEPHTYWHHLQYPDGKIKIDTDPKATLRREGKEPPRDLRTVDVDSALDLVAKERELDRLNAWLEKEGRSDVVAALQQRIAVLS
jgi:hypothetical protein